MNNINSSVTAADISIHALLAESDQTRRQVRHSLNISIHALLAESDFFLFMVYSMFVYFYPRSPCGERHASKDAIKAIANFYPRSPCGERPSGIESCSNCSSNFYPRSPCGERPLMGNLLLSTMMISIHALLAESDSMGLDGRFKL